MMTLTSKPSHLLDTGWIIRYLRGSRDYVEATDALEASRLALSILSLAELYEGVYRASDPAAARHALTAFAADKTVLPITEEICEVFGQHQAVLRKQNQLVGDMDLLIAATCLCHRLTLATTNPGHFQRVPGLAIVSDPAVLAASA